MIREALKGKFHFLLVLVVKLIINLQILTGTSLMKR